jgi:hypothetical protein
MIEREEFETLSLERKIELLDIELKAIGGVIDKIEKDLTAYTDELIEARKKLEIDSMLKEFRRIVEFHMEAYGEQDDN